MALASPLSTPNKYIAGHFTAKFSANSSYSSAGASYVTIGSTETGWTLEVSLHEEEVHDDAYGQGVADTIIEGADYNVSGLAVEAAYVQASPPNVLWSIVGGTEAQTNNAVGQRGSDMYGTLQLQPIPGTPAAVVVGAGNAYFFDLAACTTNFSLLFGSPLRKIPLHFRVLPNPLNGNKAYRIATASS